MKVCSKQHIWRVWRETLVSKRWQDFCAANGYTESPRLRRIMFRKDMNGRQGVRTLMAAHYTQIGSDNLLTVNRQWFLKASKQQIRAVVRHEMLHFLLVANGVKHGHDKRFVAACKAMQAHHK